MSTTITLKGKTIKRPGVYALVESGIKYPPQNLSYGNICIIDSGLGAGFTGGAGVLGELTQGVDSVYAIDTLQQFQAFVKGGPLWDLGASLFKPAQSGVFGVSKVYLIKAAETTGALVAYTFANGTISFQTLDEGLGANGVVTSGVLSKGYGCKFVESTTTPGKYIIEFYHGSFTGTDALNNKPYDGIEQGLGKPALLFATTPLATIGELIAWCNASNQFKAVFQIASSTITTTGAFVAGDLVTNAAIKLGAGATETYNASAFDEAIRSIKDLDNTFFLSLDSGADATNLNNEKILDFIVNDSKYEKFMVVAGGYDKATFAGGAGTSQNTANYYNTDSVIVVHGGYKASVKDGFILKSQLDKAAMVLGRMCGLEPQVPITFKSMNISAEIHKLSDEEKDFALDNGIVTTHYDNELGYHIIQQGINTLVNNQYLVNEDGSSHDIAVKRITAQLNKEISINAKITFFGKNSGPNRNTVTEEDIKAWLEGFLQSKTASTLDDNLIIRFGNINAVTQGDVYYVTYEFVPNYPISKIIITGTILEK
jgi:hypothetical protein